MSKGNKSNSPTLAYEDKAGKNGFSFVIGIDEAGRGPLAGPVVAAAVWLKKRSFRSKILDSKLISPQQREKAFHEIYDNAYVGVGIISEDVIDRINILEATFVAMTNAVYQLISLLPVKKQQARNFENKVCLLVDGNRFKNDLPYRCVTVVGGDAQVFSIACASIVAKVTRDRILRCYDRIYPQYGFNRHKGYPTVKHKEAIRNHGLSPIHRKSFRY